MENFTINAIVSYGERARNSTKRRGWYSWSNIHTKFGIITALTDTEIQVLSKYADGDEYTKTFTQRKSGNWVEKGEQDDNFDRVSLKLVDLSTCDFQSDEYNEYISLGVDSHQLNRLILTKINNHIEQYYDIIEQCKDDIKWYENNPHMSAEQIQDNVNWAKDSIKRYDNQILDCKEKIKTIMELA